jgi:putative ABC transport system substrate-binding protein
MSSTSTGAWPAIYRSHPLGAQPGHLQVQALTSYKPVVNLKTAKALGLTIPPSILARADEAIE